MLQRAQLQNRAATGAVVAALIKEAQLETEFAKMRGASQNVIAINDLVIISIIVITIIVVVITINSTIIIVIVIPLGIWELPNREFP